MSFSCPLEIETDNAYVTFHDEQWGVPVYDDKYVRRHLHYYIILFWFN